MCEIGALILFLGDGMTDQKWIALLGFIVAACSILAAVPQLAEYAWVVNLIGALVAAFIAAWFGVRPTLQARAKNKALK